MSEWAKALGFEVIIRCRSAVFLGACPRGRRRRGLRAAWGATGQLSGIWLGLWVSASGGAAQSASIFISRLHLLNYGKSKSATTGSVKVLG